MNILIIGQGGREHALAWKIAQSPKTTHVFVAPGNAGTALEEKVSNVSIDSLNFDQLIHFSKENSIALTIIGPEVPLAHGIVDAFEAAGLVCLGPSQQAAQLEASKKYSKDFMIKQGIPTAHYASFDTLAPAIAYINTQTFPLVIKADGLAAGKGVVIAQNKEEAIQTAQEMLEAQRFSEAGKTIVIEEFLSGEEASFIVISDGETALPLASSQDHKARDDGDKGPNTGGMGAYSPSPLIDQKREQFVLNTVIQPVIDGLKAQGTPYRGFLYAGLMITPAGDCKVLEFNCRFGDPETQVILPRLKSDFLSLCLAATEGKLKEADFQWDKRTALGVVLAAKGYPFNYPKGDVISGLDNAEDNNHKVFHAGTKQVDEKIVTNGGRVLCVTALANDVKTAQEQAYQKVETIDWPNKYYRHDIGHRAL